MAKENEAYLQSREKPLGIIQDLGFEESGYWFLENGELSFKLSNFQSETNILYAFVANDKVMYIGKSVQTLLKRMYLYKKCGPSQRTNIRNHASIKACLEQGQAVRIFAFIQKDPLEYKGIPINIAAGLEDNLISLLKPKWNITGIYKNGKRGKMKIHVEVFIASRILGQRQGTFAPQEIIKFIQTEFKDLRSGVSTHVSSVCVANAPLNTPNSYNYLWRTKHATLRVFRTGIDLPSAGREHSINQPEWEDVPEIYKFLLAK